jgi:hypothetical protein
LARRTPRFGAAWRFSAQIAREELEGRNEEPDQLIRYYMQEELTPLKNACRFRKEFVPVVKAGRHDFFREPASWEREKLAHSEPDVCKRYAALLEEQRLKAKRRAAQLKAKKGKHVAKLKARKKQRVAGLRH